MAFDKHEVYGGSLITPAELTLVPKHKGCTKAALGQILGERKG
jgi:hypothetical protein